MNTLTAAERAQLRRALEARLDDVVVPLALVVAEVVAELLAARAPSAATRVKLPRGDGSSLADEVWFTTEQAVTYTSCSEPTIGRHARAGTLRSVGGGHGRPRKYRREWLDAWIEKAPRLRK